MSQDLTSQDITHTESAIVADAEHNKKVSRVFKKIGYINGVKLSQTLQGGIWRASASTTNNNTVVIKVTNQFFHRNQISVINDKIYTVNEDILMEQKICKYLTQHKDCPDSITKFIRFIKSNTDYYFVMEDGGESLFKFIKKAHNLIQAGQIHTDHWMNVVKIIFNQMVECIYYIHSKNVCHFDISLENFLINDVRIEVETISNVQHKSSKVRFLTDGIQIKICDFGLAEVFPKSECLSCKHVGKQQYKSPEVINKKKQFDAKHNDCWCLGVCLFMMITGHPPWTAAHPEDTTFVYIMNGYIRDVLKGWNCLHVDENVINLIGSIFQYESNRISFKDIQQHSWLKSIHN